ncbi:13611_t:CDS:2 [Funneliformis geosporum]|nr:13611_t:CDS:2 [Funneliformis geosporum]
MMFRYKDYFPVRYKPPNNRAHIIIAVPTSTTGHSQQGNPLGTVFQVEIFLNIYCHRTITENSNNFSYLSALMKSFQVESRLKPEQLNWIIKQHEFREQGDKIKHLIPILAGGSGIEKNRFLDEIEILLKKYIEESSNKDVREDFANMRVKHSKEEEELLENLWEIRFYCAMILHDMVSLVRELLVLKEGISFFLEGTIEDLKTKLTKRNNDLKQAEAVRDTYLVERDNVCTALVTAMVDLKAEKAAHNATKAERNIVIDE